MDCKLYLRHQQLVALKKVGGIISMGGDHTIAFPLLKAINKINNGPVALVHFDAHLATWET